MAVVMNGSRDVTYQLLLSRRDGVPVRISVLQSLDLDLFPKWSHTNRLWKWYTQLPCLALSTKGIVWKTPGTKEWRQLYLIFPLNA